MPRISDPLLGLLIAALVAALVILHVETTAAEHVDRGGVVDIAE